MSVFDTTNFTALSAALAEQGETMTPESLAWGLATDSILGVRPCTCQELLAVRYDDYGVLPRERRYTVATYRSATGLEMVFLIGARYGFSFVSEDSADPEEFATELGFSSWEKLTMAIRHRRDDIRNEPNFQRLLRKRSARALIA